MTYGDKIRSMNDKDLAEFLSNCVIPENKSNILFIGSVGHSVCTEDLEKKLGEQIEGDNDD